MAPKKIRNLLDVSIEEKRKFINSFDHILTDCDGTVWTLDGTIDGVGSAIKSLQKHGKKLVYISNNSLRSDDSYREKFKKSEIHASIDDIIHPAVAATQYLKQRHFKGLVYIIGGPVFKKTFKDAGFDTIDGPNQFVDEHFLALWQAVKDNQPVKAVVIDTDFNLTSTKLIRAQLYLQDPECLFIVGTTDCLLPINKQIKILGPGLFYKLLEDATGRKATVVGKPGNVLTEMILKKYELTDLKRILFIGDMLEQDIGFGNASGFQTLVVLTGGTTKDDLRTHSQEDELPQYYLDSFADFAKVLETIADQ